MNKKVIISFLLLFAFSFLLAHNFIPHHHHEDVSEKNHDKHHHHDSEKHHHKKEHDNKSEKHDENLPIELFSHTSTLFIHSELSISINRQGSKNLQPKLNLIGKIESQYKQLKIPLAHKLSYFYLFDNSTQTYCYSNSHRGPPFLS